MPAALLSNAIVINNLRLSTTLRAPRPHCLALTVVSRGRGPLHVFLKKSHCHSGCGNSTIEQAAGATYQLAHQ
jgi:hypothetical protein